MAFAEFLDSNGEYYYPKLVGTVPFTAASGFRVLHSMDNVGFQSLELILQSAKKLVTETAGGGLHLLWTDPVWRNHPEVRRILEKSMSGNWVHPHFLWSREGKVDFKAYLSGFQKNQRRNIRREVASAPEQGLEIKVIKSLLRLRFDTGPGSWDAQGAED